jgi:predicted nucleic acid-binding protein
MLIGIDTGFFYALEEGDTTAAAIWEKNEIVTSVIVLYELNKAFLKGKLKGRASLMADIRRSVRVEPITEAIALEASLISHGTNMPGLDALILSSLIFAGCKVIYTKDHHLTSYRKKGLKIIAL